MKTIQDIATKTATKWKERASRDRKNRKSITERQLKILKELEESDESI